MQEQNRSRLIVVLDDLMGEEQTGVFCLLFLSAPSAKLMILKTGKRSPNRSRSLSQSLQKVFLRNFLNIQVQLNFGFLLVDGVCSFSAIVVKELLVLVHGLLDSMKYSLCVQRSYNVLVNTLSLMSL